VCYGFVCGSAHRTWLLALIGTTVSIHGHLECVSGWRAPETLVEINGKQVVSFKTDVYMFGCLIYEVLTGEDPFFWLPSGVSIAGYRMRDPLNIPNPLDAAAAEGKLSYVMADSPVRTALESLSRHCMKQVPEERPNMISVLESLDDIRNKRYLVETRTELHGRYGGETGVPPPSVS
jgi:serine/threonine protein kinase